MIHTISNACATSSQTHNKVLLGCCHEPNSANNADTEHNFVLQVAELNAKVQDLEAQFDHAVQDKEAAIRESERCQLKLQLANRLINALASEGGTHSWGRWGRH